MTEENSPTVRESSQEIITREREDIGFGKSLKAMARNLFGAVGLWVFPYPISIFRRALAGKKERDGDLEFYCHPRFAITSHVIFIGWITALGFLIFGEGETVTTADRLFAWPWIAIISLTFVAMGRDWEIISALFVAGGIVIVVALMVIIELLSDTSLFKPLYDVTKSIPVHMQWGTPFLLSSFLGFCYVLMAAYQRVDDVWRLPKSGNLLDHYRFERSDTSISKGGKTFRADWPCMLKKWFFFGYGDILILDAHSKRILHTIKGVFFARYHAEVLKFRFATTDTTEIDEEIMLDELEAEEEEHSSEDLH